MGKIRPLPILIRLSQRIIVKYLLHYDSPYSGWVFSGLIKGRQFQKNILDVLEIRFVHSIMIETLES